MWNSCVRDIGIQRGVVKFFVYMRERERERFLIVCEEMASNRAEGYLWNLVLIVVCEERRRLRGEWWLRTFG